MKCIIVFVLALSVLCIVSTKSLPARNGMFFYQAAPGYYNPGAQRAMLVQYGGPNRRAALEEGGVSAFAAGNTIAAGTYLKDCKTTETEAQEDQAEVKYDDGEHVSSVADAYPEQFPLNQNEQVVPSVEEEEFVGVHPQTEQIPEDVPNHKTPKELVPEEEEEAPAVEESEPAFVPAPAAVPAVVPENKKKVRVELETADDEDDYPHFNPHTKSQSNNGRGNVPASSYFPINFGSTNGGAIAVANSFSTGKGGTATSTATAYGSPAKPKTKKRLVESQ